MAVETLTVPYGYLPLEYDYWFDEIHEQVLPAIADLANKGEFTLGDAVERFEKQFAGATGYKYAVGVSSGTSALSLALLATGVKPGDAVVTVPNTFVATVGAICAIGARPVFVDVGPDYLADIHATFSRSVQAMMPVELTGRPFPIIRWPGMESPFKLIVDAAQSIGARGGERGDLKCFSLHPLKNVHVWGDGGMICTDDGDLAVTLRLLRNHGLETRDLVTMPGYNERLSPLQAVVGMWSLSHLEWVTQRRIANAMRYDTGLADCPGVVLPPRNPNIREVFHTYVIQVAERDRLARVLKDVGIETKVHYPIPLHLQKGFAHLGYLEGDFPVAEAQAQRILTLPVNEYLTTGQIDYVIDQIRQFYMVQGAEHE